MQIVKNHIKEQCFWQVSILAGGDEGRRRRETGRICSNQSSAQLNTQNIYKMWGNFVDTQANTLTYKATYLKKKKKKKVQDSAGENSLFLRVQTSLKR